LYSRDNMPVSTIGTTLCTTHYIPTYIQGNHTVPVQGRGRSPMSRQMLKYYCHLNKAGRGKLREEFADSETVLQTVDGQDTATTYALLRFRPDLWSQCNSKQNP